MLLSRIERQDIWDQMLSADLEMPVRPVGVFICPEDSKTTLATDHPGLSYVVNSGTWEVDGSEPFVYLSGNGKGDTTANGVFMNLYQGTMKSRLSGIQDGAATTIMLSENVDREFEMLGGGPRFSWASGDLFGQATCGYSEGLLGILWVVNDNPPPGLHNDQPDLYMQERINRNDSDTAYFGALWPRFARPASEHVGGVNVAYCDGHIEFLRQDIEYGVYQRLLTSNGAKCVDPLDHNNGVNPPKPESPIYKFRHLPPLADSDYR
jgi:prepilin-type processing-associated H-X9-DG protein